ncbi:MAG: hypothetical protein ABI945_03820 [Nitrospirales bacterium]
MGSTSCAICSRASGRADQPVVADALRRIYQADSRQAAASEARQV